MAKKKDLVIVALATFCLTTSLFMIVSTRSQSQSQYDPWVDLNDDGQINILEAIIVSNHYLESGDPINKTALLIEVNATYASLVSRIDSLNTTIAAMNASLIAQQSKIDSLNATLASLLSRVDNLEANYSSSIPSNSSYTYSYAATSEAYSWVDIPAMSVTLTVNRTSNLMILFSTDAYCSAGPQETTRIFIQAIVNSTAADPNYVTLTPCVQVTGTYGLIGHAHALSEGAYSYIFNMPTVTPGFYTIKIQWRVIYSSPQGIGVAGSRTLTVIALPT
jgi:uncharacterized coiled-coil protein SlyX